MLAGTASANHHHGGLQTAIFVVSGPPVFVFADDEPEIENGGEAGAYREVRLETQAGDYVYVPPFVGAPCGEPGPE